MSLLHSRARERTSTPAKSKNRGSVSLTGVRARFGAGLLALVVWCGLASSASAEATVIVDLKTADGGTADGTVELKKGDAKYSCTTQKGRCELKGVPGGMYSVEVSQADKPAPKAKTVMIPPSGEVKLIVNASS